MPQIRHCEQSEAISGYSYERNCHEFFNKNSCNDCLKLGFTLIEMSVVLLIIAVILGSGIVTLNATVKRTQYDATVDKMAVIEKALLDFSLTNRRLPCPSDLTLTVSSSNYGVEATNNGGSCTGGAISANYTSAASTGSAGAVEGGIPVQALGLSNSYMYDAYGRRFRYAVNSYYTVSANYALPVPLGGVGVSSYYSANMTVYSLGWDSTHTLRDYTRSNKAIYAILSHGENGHGGYTLNGTMLNSGSTNNDELINCHDSASPPSSSSCLSTTTGSTQTSITMSYVQKLPSSDSTTDLTQKFDDIVVYKEAWQMRSPDTQILPSPANIIVMDTGASSGNRVQQYNNSTLTWTPKSDISANATSIFIDNSQNIWATDITNTKLVKSTDGGATWTSKCGGITSYGVYVDASNNIWLADNVNGKIQKSTDGGTTCNNAGATALSSPNGISGNSSTNIWIADTGNNAIKQYNGTNTITNCASTTTFSAPQGIYVDANSNVWVADTANNRIQKCVPSNSNATCTCIVWGGTTAGTANGQFDTPVGITGDAAGNIWVTEQSVTNNKPRIQKYSNGTWSIFSYYGANNTAFTTSLYGIAVSGR